MGVLITSASPPACEDPRRSRHCSSLRVRGGAPHRPAHRPEARLSSADLGLHICCVPPQPEGASAPYRVFLSLIPSIYTPPYSCDPRHAVVDADRSSPSASLSPHDHAHTHTPAHAHTWMPAIHTSAMPLLLHPLLTSLSLTSGDVLSAVGGACTNFTGFTGGEWLAVEPAAAVSVSVTKLLTSGCVSAHTDASDRAANQGGAHTLHTTKAAQAWVLVCWRGGGVCVVGVCVRACVWCGSHNAQLPHAGTVLQHWLWL